MNVERRGVAPYIPSFGAGNEWSATRPGCFTPVYKISVLKSELFGLCEGDRKSFFLPGIETGIPALSGNSLVAALNKVCDRDESKPNRYVER
jgi:hypothetical protein